MSHIRHIFPQDGRLIRPSRPSAPLFFSIKLFLAPLPSFFYLIDDDVTNYST